MKRMIKFATRVTALFVLTTSEVLAHSISGEAGLLNDLIHKFTANHHVLFLFLLVVSAITLFITIKRFAFGSR